MKITLKMQKQLKLAETMFGKMFTKNITEMWNMQSSKAALETKQFDVLLNEETEEVFIPTLRPNQTTESPNQMTDETEDSEESYE